MSKRVLVAGLVATAVAAGVAVAIYLLASLFGADLIVRGDDEIGEITAGNVLVLTVVAMLLGSLVRAVLARRVSRPARVFTIAAVVVTLLSFSTLTADITWPDRAWLASMHVAVGAVAVVMLGRPLAGDDR